MTAKKAPIGEQYIRAQAAFEKKYANNPELIKEVKALTDLLQIWHIHVMLTCLDRDHQEEPRCHVKLDRRRNMPQTTVVLVCECDNECTHWEIGDNFIKCATCGHIFEGVELVMPVLSLTSTGGTLASFKEREV